MASREKDFQEIFYEPDTKKRKHLLAKVLQFPEFKEDDDLRTAIVLDMYYDTFLFLVTHGFPWREVVVVFEMFKNLLHEIREKSLVEAITLFTQQLGTTMECSSENNLKSIVDYAFSTIFQHYKLYQFILTRDRTEDVAQVLCIVEPPRIPPAMSEGVLKSVWDEEQRLKEIDEMEQQRTQEREAYYKLKIEQDLQQLGKPLSELDTGVEQITKEQLASLIKEATAQEATLTNTLIHQRIDEVHDSLEYKYLRSNAGTVKETQGRKSTSSRRSKARSGK